MADGKKEAPRGRPRNKLLAVLADEESGRRRLSSTEAGQYVRVIIQRLPRHLKELQNEMLDNPEVQNQINVENLKQIATNLNKIITLVYDQLKLVTPEVKYPMLLPLPDDKTGLLLILKQQIITLPNHVKKLGGAFAPEEIKKKAGLDWKKVENPVNLDRIDSLIQENNTHLQFHKRMLPVSAMKL